MTEPNTRTGSMLGPYRLGKLLGRGGMGEVYEAFDTGKERTVALKLLPPYYANDKDFRERFERESKTASKLSEPHVIPIHDWGEHDGVLFIDMRFVEGRDLRKILSAGPIEPRRAIDILTQIAGALDSAHRNGLVHRDVKPDNILINSDDFAYLVDFGIAHGASDTHLTMAGTALGTLAYMAPERLGDSPAGPASDIYALACVLYESITGIAPFPAKTDAGVMTAHLTQPPPTTGGPLDPVIARGMAKDPAQRFATARDLMRAAATAYSVPHPTPTQPHPPAGPRTHTPPPGPVNSGPAVGYPGAPAQYDNPAQYDQTMISRPTAHPAPHAQARTGYPGPANRISAPSPVPSNSFGTGGSAPGGSAPYASGPTSTPHSLVGGGGGFGPPTQSGPQHLSGPQGWSAPHTSPPAKSGKGKTLALVGLAAVVVLALAGVGAFFALRGSGDDTEPEKTAAPPPTVSTASCTYTDRSTDANYKRTKPDAKQPDTGTVDATLAITGYGDIDMTLDRAAAPCNVGAVVSYMKAGYYTGSACSYVGDGYMYCGSPDGKRGTNPGWTNPDELPKNLASAGTDSKTGKPLYRYPAGTVAIIDDPDDQGATGSVTMVLMTKDFDLPLTFSVIGKLTSSGLETATDIIDKVKGPSSGPPTSNVTISTAKVS